MEKNSMREVSRQSGVPASTLSRWANNADCDFKADVADDKGELVFYSEAMIELARKLDQERNTKTADKTECAGGNGDNSDGEQAVEIVDDREDDGSNDDVDDDTTAVDELPESITTPAQIDEIQGVDVVAVETPMTIETSAEIVTLDVRANRIRRLQADVQKGIIEIGFELIAAKKEVKHGDWANWLKTNFDWTQQTANRFMRVAERFGKLNNVIQFQPSTLQAMLALPEGDEEKFIEVQASAGKPVEKLSAREVQKAVKKWRKPKTEDAGQEVKGEYFQILPRDRQAASVSIKAVPQKSAEPPTVKPSVENRPDPKLATNADDTHETKQPLPSAGKKLNLPLDRTIIHEFINTAALDDLENFHKELSRLAHEVKIKIGELKSTAGDSGASNEL